MGIQGSALGLGCMRFPKKEVDGKMVVDEENAINIIRTAIDGGVTYMDTAYVYLDQTSEVILGKALQDGYRERVTIATKLPTWMVEKGRGYAALLLTRSWRAYRPITSTLSGSFAQCRALVQDQLHWASASSLTA